MRGRHTVLRKELFASRRELVLWTSWGLLHRHRERRHRLVWRHAQLGRRARRSATSWPSSGTRSCCSIRCGTSSTPSRSCSDRWRRWSACSRCWRWTTTSPTGRRPRWRRARCTSCASSMWSSSTATGGRCCATSPSSVPGGTVVALVGRSGAGKTTVTDLVARFHDPTRGRILLNGTDIRDFRCAAIATCSASCSRTSSCSTARCATTSRTRGPTPPRRRSLDAARRANAHEFIERLPDGLRHVHRRARRQALGRPAAAAGHRARHPRVPADPHPRRSDQQPRHRERTTHPGLPRHAARRSHHLRHRPSAVDHAARPT